ncbi:MAG: CoA transferase [Rhodospirillales bacterium]|nr:CoA transferase [Rhodospirillales bacterium]
MRPLDGVRVVDVTEGAQGPFAATLLADLGAEVVKVERPGGELMRRSGPFAGGLALPCLTICRGRLALLEIDMKTAEGLAIVQRLVAASDVLIQNWKIGTDRRLGLDFETCAARNPRLVYVRSSGFGARGPFAAEGSMDMLSQAASGMASVSGPADGPSERTRTPVLDFVSAFSAAEAAMIGLAARDQSQSPQLVDSSQLAAGLDLLGPEIATAQAEPVGPSGGQSRQYAFGRFCPTADGTWLAVECVTQAQEAALAAAFGGSLDAVAEGIASLTQAQASQLLAAAGVPHSDVVRHFDAGTIDRRPGNLQRYIDPRVGEIRYPEVPWIFSDTPVRAGAPAGRVGRDNAALAALLRRWEQVPASPIAAE